MSVQYNTKPFRMDPQVEVVFKSLNRIIISIAFIYSLIFAIPVVQLTNTKFITLFTPVIGIIVSVVVRLLMRKKEKDSNKTCLNEMHFQKISYNSASIGNVSAEVEEELTVFNQAYKPNPFNKNIISYINGSYSSKFKGFKAIFEEIIKIVNPKLKNGLQNNIVIRERTTDAINKILETIKAQTNKIFAITTNAEYPEVINSINEIIDDSKFIELEKELLDGTCSEHELSMEIVNNAKSKIGNVDYIIVLLSNIYYKTGTIIGVEEIISEINRSFNDNERKKIIYICDGAQAVGNIEIPKSLIYSTHFYVFGGHKWLMSLPNIGFAINNKRLIKGSNLDFNKFMLTNRSFSTYNYNTDEFKGTIDPYPYISLYMSLVDLNRVGIKVIQEHNKWLSEYFKECVKTTLAYSKPLNLRPSGGLATVQSDKAAQLNDYLLNRYNNSSGFLVDEQKNLIRFSFHYYMGEKHVNRLVYAMLEYERNTMKNYT